MARTANCWADIEVANGVGVQLDLVLLQHAIIQPLVQALLACLARGPLEQYDLHTCSHRMQSYTKKDAFSFAATTQDETHTKLAASLLWFRTGQLSWWSIACSHHQFQFSYRLSTLRPQMQSATPAKLASSAIDGCFR